MAVQISLTDKELALSPFPELPKRLSQRQSSSRTQAVNARTFTALVEWQNFLSGAAAVSLRLDNVLKQNTNPMVTWKAGLEPAADECAVRGCLEQILFQQVNYLANKLGLTLNYKSGGSGRALSFTDMVIIDTIQPQNIDDLSARVIGNGEAKGYWQWEVLSSSFEEALNSPREHKMCVEVLQQLYGDMVNDEAIGGFLSNYNQTVFFYRDNAESKSLFFSPIIKIGDAPIEKFLYALEFIEQRKHFKASMSRILVKETPTQGYMIRLPQVMGTSTSGRTLKRTIQDVHVKTRRIRRREVQANLEFYDEDHLCDIPAYPLEQLGVTGQIVAIGKHGNILHGQLQGEKMALKTFDLRREVALRAFLMEQKVYHHLKDLQGLYLPSLLLVGRLPHTSVLYLGLTNELQGRLVKDLLRSRRSKEVEKAILEGLDHIHRARVLHGDISLSNMLFNQGTVKFIDFEYSVLFETKEHFKAELLEMEELLQDAKKV